MTSMKMEDRDAATQMEYDEQSYSGSEDGDSTQTPIEEEHRCRYPSKYCGRARAQKTNGTYHRFCQYHRIKANTNQKRWTSVRRQQAAMEEQQRRRVETLPAVRSVPMGYPMYDHGPYMQRWTPGLLPDPVNIDPTAEPVALAVEDVQILNALFVSDMGYDQRSVQAHPMRGYYQETHKNAFAYSNISL